MGTFECTLCARNYNLRSGLEGHILNYHTRREKKIRRKSAEKKTTVDLGKVHTKSSCLALSKPKNVPPTDQPKTLSSTNTNHLETPAELLLDMSEVLANNTMYTFEAWVRQVEEENNTIMSTEQNGQLDTTISTTPSPELSDQHQNTSPSDNQFKLPEVPPLRRYRHPTFGLNSNDNYNFIDLRGDYVWADEAIWESNDYGC
ncbi:unnamed protein product [Aphis gossypii]|uniref:C2H2-type domain-containing protein n=1 Tax=Aphis gossypii TaxID=80765 RepID=A0A9P0IQY9_APHGO|nr:unnamed protein product [Aphis gossypii]